MYFMYEIAAYSKLETLPLRADFRLRDKKKGGGQGGK